MKLLLIIFLFISSESLFSQSKYVFKNNNKNSFFNTLKSFSYSKTKKYNLRRCLELNLDIKRTCCSSSVSAQELESYLNIRTREFRCPNSDQIMTLKCFESGTDFNRTIEIEDPAGVNFICKDKIQRYLNHCSKDKSSFDRKCIENPSLPECNNYSSLNFCADKQSTSAVGMYLSCEALDDYWWGDRRENNDDDSKDVIPLACDPLGDPEDLDLPEEDIISVEYDSNNPPIPSYDDEDNEEVPLHESEINQEQLEASVKDQIIKILRLEIPGSFLRFQGSRQFIKNNLKKESDEDISVSCNMNDYSCKVNVLSLGANSSNDFKSSIESSLDNMNRKKAREYPNKDYFTMSTRTITSGQYQGIEIYDIEHAGKFKPDEDTFRLRFKWNGKIRVYPTEKMKFNFKEGASLYWVNSHSPMGKNGYETSFQNKKEYLDKAGVILGLSEKSCNYLNNLEVKLSPSSEEYTRASSLEVKITSEGEQKESSQYITYFNPYACRCNLKDGVQAQEDKFRYCIYDPHKKNHDIDIPFTIIRKIKDDGDLKKTITHTVTFKLFKQNNLNHTTKILKAHRMLKKIGRTDDAEYDKDKRILTIQQLNLHYDTDIRRQFARTLLNRSDNYLQGKSLEEALQLLQAPGEYFDTDTEEEDNVNKIKVEDNNLISYCINSEDQGGATPQFYKTSNEDDLYTYSELNSDDNLARYFDFNSPTLRRQIQEDIKNYGCSGTVVSLITRGEKPSRVISSTAGIKGKVSIDLGKLAIEEPNAGFLLIAFDTNFTANYEKIVNKKKRDWYWVFQVIWEFLKMLLFTIISALVSFMANIAYWITAPDFWGVDLGNTELTTHHTLSHHEKNMNINQDLSHNLRRITLTKPEFKIYDVESVRFDMPSCRDTSNWSDVDDVGDLFGKFLSGVFCIGSSFVQVIDFVITPFQNFIYGLANYIFGINELLAQKIHDPIINTMSLKGKNNLADLLHFSSRSIFNSNPKHIDNPLGGPANTSPTISNIFESLCNTTGGAGCIVNTILNSNNGLGRSSISGCHRREGVKTSQFALRDLNLGTNYEVNFDFPHTRFCDKGDMPSTTFDQKFYRQNYNSPFFSKSYKEYISDFREIKRVDLLNFIALLGPTHQCSGFFDIEFKGIMEMEKSEGAQYENYIEFLPTLRSKNLLNKVTMCRSSFDCNFDQAPILRRMNLASCSLLSDMWFHEKDTSTGNLLTPPHNLIDVFSETESLDPSIALKIREKIYQEFILSKCSIYSGQEKNECIKEGQDNFDPDSFSASQCRQTLSEYLGTDNFLFNYKGNYNIDEMKQQKCSDND